MAMSMAIRSKLRSLTGTRAALALRSTVARSFSDCPQPQETISEAESPTPTPTPTPAAGETIPAAESPTLAAGETIPAAESSTPAAGENVHFIDRIKQSIKEKGACKVEPMKLSSLSGYGDLEEEDIDEPPLPATPGDVEEIFNEMKEAGLVPNAVAMLDGLCKDGLMPEAMRLFGLMRENGSMPEVIVYTAVVDGFCKAHRMDDAIRIFRKMQTNGVVPNTYSYQLLIRALSATGGEKRLQEASEFFVEMIEAGHKPNMMTFVGLIDAYCKEKGVEEGRSAVKALTEKGFSFDEKEAKDYMDKKGPYESGVWDAIVKKNKSTAFKAPRFA